MTSERVLKAAAVYLDADPRQPTRAVADALGTSRTAAAKLVARARTAGFIPTSRRGKAIQRGGLHQPRTVRWSDASESWLACAECRTPWPCESVDE